MGEARVEYVVSEAPRKDDSLTARHTRLFESPSKDAALEFFNECLVSNEKWYYLEECYIKTERTMLESK